MTITLLSKLTPFVIGAAIPNQVGWASAWTTQQETKSDWYQGLKKPWYQPPAWVFPVAWTGLYTTMGAASTLVWQENNGFIGSSRLPLALYAAQLVANGLWSPLFFRSKCMGTALADILIMDVLVAACVASFWEVNPTAGALMVPYLAWSLFATLLNFKIWNDNRETPKDK